MIEVLGVYSVIGSHQPCCLIEIVLKGVPGDWDFNDFTQEVEGLGRDNWQVPYDEHFLNEKGTCDLDLENYDLRPSGCDFRFVFFFHYPDFSKSLLTPFGSVSLPAEQAMPERLAFIKYDRP